MRAEGHPLTSLISDVPRDRPTGRRATAQHNLVAAGLVGALAFTTSIARAADALPSWNDTASKKSIVAFVERVTKEGSPDFVPPNERIATFDNDGTLWCEQPMYFQFLSSRSTA